MDIENIDNKVVVNWPEFMVLYSKERPGADIEEGPS